MLDRFRARDKSKTYFVTLTVTDKLFVFATDYHKLVIVDSLCYCQKQLGLEINAWCLMGNHLHMLCSVKGEFDLPTIIQRFKRHTTKILLASYRDEPKNPGNRKIDRFAERAKSLKTQDNKIWDNGYHALEMHTPELAWKKMQYIHQNPVKAGMVEYAEDYVYSSAQAYKTNSNPQNCILRITFL